MLILIEVHRRLILELFESVDLEIVVEHCIRSRNHGLRSRYGWIERCCVTGSSIVLDNAIRVRVRGRLRALDHPGNTGKAERASALSRLPPNPK